MSRPKGAPRAAAQNVAASLAALLSPARAAASRRNGAKSRGPKTPEGKARSAKNALKHGLRAQRYVVLPDEDAAEFAALDAGLMEELAPEGALQSLLAQRVVAAAWRLARAERLETELFAENHLAGRSLGLALIRDCNRARAFDTLLRYRGGTLAELWRALRTLKALQAERAAQIGGAAPAPAQRAAVTPARAPKVRDPAPGPVGERGPNPPLAQAPARTTPPGEPESPENPADSGRAPDRAEPGDPGPAHASLPPRPPAMPGGPAPCAQPIEPKTRRQPAESAPPALAGRRPGGPPPPTDPSRAMVCHAALRR